MKQKYESFTETLLISPLPMKTQYTIVGNEILMSTRPSGIDITIDITPGKFYLRSPIEVESQINQNSKSLENISTLSQETELTGKTTQDPAESV